MIKHSKLSVSLYDFSNLGNVFLESLTLGTPMLTENIENSLDLIDKDVYFEIDPKRTEESADMLQVIFDNENQIPKGHKHEVEIRANTIWAVEFIKEQLKKYDSTHVNDHLWLLGQDKLPGDKPYHRTRTTSY